MQESCLRLMGKKLLVSLAIEGKFSSEGLQAINEEDDILKAMARELVTEKGIGERADAVWSALQKKQDEVLEVKSTETEAPILKPIEDGALVVVENPVAAANQWMPPGTAREPIRRKGSRREGLLETQLTLF